MRGPFHPSNLQPSLLLGPQSVTFVWLLQNSLKQRTSSYTIESKNCGGALGLGLDLERNPRVFSEIADLGFGIALASLSVGRR